MTTSARVPSGFFAIRISHHYRVKCVVQAQAIWVYVGGVAGRDRHYRIADQPSTPGAGQSPRGGPVGQV